MTTSIDCEEYDRLMNESLQRETFSEFIDHFVKFRPEFREQFGLIHEANKRQKAIEKLREFNQVLAKTKDERFHNLISSLTDLRSEQKLKK
jgi:predicted CopG family antitoxin